jgi:hypothetical protein
MFGFLDFEACHWVFQHIPDKISRFVVLVTDLRLPLMGGLYKLVLQWLWLMRRGSTEVRFLIGEFPTLFGTDLGERLQLWARWGGFLQSSDLNDELGDMALCVQFVVFFSTVSLRTSASNGPWDLFAVRLWNGGSLSNAWMFHNLLQICFNKWQYSC